MDWKKREQVGMVSIVVREKKMCETLKRKYAESCGIFIVLFPGIAVTSAPPEEASPTDPTGCWPAGLIHLYMKHLRELIRGRSIRESKHPLNPWNLWGCVDLFSLSSTWSVISWTFEAAFN